ncbi:MAG: dihydrofolate reductase [Solirubrobacterales bacterium]|nr:dihydrofolate reductase [Solirubrobacterales bacterium]
MSRVIYYTATTLNGFIATDENSLDWLFEVGSPEAVDFQSFLDGIDVLVCGSTTYEWVYAHENLAERPEKWREFYGERPAFVFTSRELATPEGADVRLVNGQVTDHLETIRGEAGDGDIWMIGGGDLAGQFLDAGALDELQVTITPVTLTSGAPLFPREIRSDRLELVSAEKFGQSAHLTLRVKPA